MSREVSEDSSSSSSHSEDTESGGPPSLSFFHVQPPTLSHGYEDTPEYRQALERIQRDYKNDYLNRKDRRRRCAQTWLDFKKPLDERRLCQAVSMNNTATVQYLLKKGVSASCRDNLRRSPLHLAACKGYTHLVRLLLSSGADVNARDPIGNTPLHLAACTNHIDVVLLLLQAGGDGLTVDKLGRSPLQLAQSKLKLLQKASSVPDQQVKSQVTQVIELLLLFSGADSAAADRLTEFQQKVSSAESRDQVENQLQSLLESLTSLSLSQTSSS